MPKWMPALRKVEIVVALACLAASTTAARGQENQPLGPRSKPPFTGHAPFSIPLIDLSRQSERQVVVDRQDGQYLGHPTTVLLEDGRTILAVYPKGHGAGGIILKRSEDGGKTWSDRLPTPENWATSKETPTIHRVVDRSGKTRLLLFSGLYPIRESISEDDGRTWSPLAPIGDFGGIVAMASLEPLKDGDLMALFHDDGRFLHNGGKKGEFRVYKTLSKDGGLTWSAPDVIARDANSDLCEPGLIRSPDGNQIAVLLRENSRKSHSKVIFSNDEGVSWTAPRELPNELTGDRHVAKYAPDGRLVVSFRDTAFQSWNYGDWVAWVGTYDDIVKGREGQYRLRLMQNTKAIDCAYPGVEILPEGTFVATTYGHWTSGQPPYIMAVRFRLAEIDALASPKPAASQLPYSRTEDVIYGRKDGLAMTLDVFKPSKDANGAAVISVISGGFFSSHDAISPLFYAPLLARGYTVFAVVHGSQPRYDVPEAVADLNRAVRFVRHHAKDYGIDPDRIGVTGASAGGHLSLMLGTAGSAGNPSARDRVDRESSRVQAVACFFPPTDFLNYGGPGKELFRTADFDKIFRPAFDHRELDKETNTWVSITDPARLRSIAVSISPITHVSAEDAPTLILHGDADTLVPLQQSQTFVERLKAAGVPARLVVKPGAGHGWLTIIKDMEWVADWFDEHLKAAKAP